MPEPKTSNNSHPPQAGYRGFLAAILSERERFFKEVIDEIDLPRKLAYSVMTLLGLASLYGLTTGSYASFYQAISAGIKLPLLFFATFIVCFPAFFVVQILVGSRLRLLQVIVLVLGALSLTTILLAAFVPIIIFFLITGSDYYFLQLLHVVIVFISGVFGLYVLHEGLSVVCEKHGVYPRKAITIVRAWVVLFAFVGIQMAWNLRPFLGDRHQPFQVFRHYEGNYYTAIVYSVKELFKGEEESEPSDPQENRFSIEELLDGKRDETNTPGH